MWNGLGQEGKKVPTDVHVQCILYIMDTLKVALLYRGVLYVEVILYSKECNWYTRCCPLNGGVRYRECPLREAIYCTCTIIVIFVSIISVYFFSFYRNIMINRRRSSNHNLINRTLPPLQPHPLQPHPLVMPHPLVVPHPLYQLNQLTRGQGKEARKEIMKK